MEILHAALLDIGAFLFGMKGVIVLVLVGLLVYARKYLAALFCLASVVYVIGLASLGRFLTLNAFSVRVFMGYLAGGLLLIGWLGYLLFVRAPADERRSAPKHETSFFKGPQNGDIFFNKRDTSVFIGG